jgi:hypothetical protein
MLVNKDNVQLNLVVVYAPVDPLERKTFFQVVFVWKGSVESVKRDVCTLPTRLGGLGLVSIEHKARALRVACLARCLNMPDSKGFYMARYFICHKVAKIKPEWATFVSNLLPHSMFPSDYYLSVCADLAFCKDIPMEKASKVYRQLCPVVVPRVATDFWRRMHAGLDWTVIWPEVRDPITEPAKSDLMWIFLHRALKCRSCFILQEF